jgi:hypothetical protein
MDESFSLISILFQRVSFCSLTLLLDFFLKILVCTVHTSAILSSVPLFVCLSCSKFYSSGAHLHLESGNAQKLYALVFNMISSEECWYFENVDIPSLCHSYHFQIPRRQILPIRLQ